MKNLRRRLRCLAICMVLVFSSAVFAFAHPTTADTFADAITAGWTYDNSGLGSPYGKDMATSWYQIFGKNALSILRDVRYQLTGTDYDNHSGTSLHTYVNNIYSTLTSTGSGSILYGINQTNTKLSDIYNSVGVGGSGNNVLSKLSALINAVGDISIPDLTSYVANIDTGVTTINSDGVKLTGNALNRLNQIAGYTSWLSTIRDTTARIEGIDTTISAIVADTNSDLTSFNNDYNNIDWAQNGVIYGIKSNIAEDYITTTYVGKNLYVYFSKVNTDSIYRIVLPISYYNLPENSNTNLSLSFIRQNGNEAIIENKYYSYKFTQNYLIINLYITPSYYGNNDYVLHISSNTNMRFFYASFNSENIWTIESDKIDFYEVFNYISNFRIVDLFEQAKEMFFDDEALASKRANSSQTSTVLSNYTGSGSASATAADFVDLTDGVTSVKSGLNTNVSVSNVFSLFNSSDGFDFWSSETLSELNTVSSTLRSGSNTPLYDSRLSEILNLMEVNHR